MGKRWLGYGAVWCCCLLFYLSYQEWFSWILLLAVSALPWLSLLVSLPAMLTARIRVQMPQTVAMGAWITTNIVAVSKLPLPQWRCRIIARQLLWGKDWVLWPGGDFPTEHCGTVQCRVSRCRIYDYMGMFWLPMNAPAEFQISVRPRPVKPRPAPDVEQFLAQSWRPKAGGGFSENHELRLYRPGDHLKQIHWKLSAKTGQLIFREPMIPQVGRMLIWLHHSGDAAQLDRKLGKLMWVSSYLQRRGLPHDILAYTADGQRIWHIGTEHTLQEALDTLLSTAPMGGAPQPELTATAAWQFFIGGDDYETV